MTPETREPLGVTAARDDATVRVMGNTAKLYCLDVLAAMIRVRPAEPFRIVDLGAGTGAAFVPLLREFPNVSYVAVEPIAQACAVAERVLHGLPAQVVQGWAYDADVGEADAVVSFSVLEHVYRRLEYMQAVRRHMAPAGVALINYDSGHFRGPGTPRQRAKENLKTVVGRVLAAAGNEWKYQAFVREEEFRSTVAQVGLTIVDERMFNTDLKTAWKVAAHQSPELMRQWLAIELAMADGVAYRDELARVFRTRNFVLRRGASPS